MSTAVDDGSLAELHEQRDFLLRSLEDLEAEREAGDLDGADYDALCDSYTARAAAVLRAIGAASSSQLPVVPGVPRRRWARHVVTVVSVLALAGMAGALMARSAGERLPGEAATGSLTATGASSDLERARLLIGEGRTLEAIKTFDKILREDPRQPEALAYRGWLLRLAGRAGGNKSLIDSGMIFIERAVAADPTYPDAHFFRGVILFQDRGDPAGAVAEFRAFLANDPPPEMVPVVEDSLRRALAASAPAESP
ncbi:MAG TPA: tetratricopeptide repeat protein [Acidimicrobiales bacterium]|nr:tetratricopeptide repeat protein [Acidimicrobiales bacterium]